MSMSKKLVHTKCIQILPGCHDLTPRQYNAVRSSQESVAENHKKFGKVPCLLQVPDEKTSTEDELHFVCALWGWFMSCESFVDLL